MISKLTFAGGVLGTSEWASFLARFLSFPTSETAGSVKKYKLFKILKFKNFQKTFSFLWDNLSIQW
jgi:hypothetical protein